MLYLELYAAMAVVTFLLVQLLVAVDSFHAGYEGWSFLGTVFLAASSLIWPWLLSATVYAVIYDGIHYRIFP